MCDSFSVIYKYYEKPTISDPNDPNNLSYQCKYCAEIKAKKGIFKAIKGINSNLVNHLKREDHEEINKLYLAEYNLAGGDGRARKKPKLCLTPQSKSALL